MAWHPAEADTIALVAQFPEEVHDMADERAFSIFAVKRLQARHWVRVNYSIVLYRIHVPMIVQCQGDGRSLSSKNGAVTWESFGQLAASRLTILEMAINDCCCPHSLINLRSIGVDFIMWSTSSVIFNLARASSLVIIHLITLSMRLCLLGSYSCVPGGRPAWYIQGTDHFCINLGRGQSFLYLATSGLGRGSSHATFSIM